MPPTVDKKKYITTDKTNENGEKLFKLVELVTDNKTFPIKKDNRIKMAMIESVKESTITIMFCR